MTMLKVKLLTSLKESSGSVLTSGSKVYPSGAILNGTMDTLPKAVVDAIKGNEWYVKVTEVKADLIPEILPSGVSAPNPTVEDDGTEDSKEDEGQSIGSKEKSSEKQPKEDLKGKIKKADRKLKSKE